jgi:hypothetical protein
MKFTRILLDIFLLFCCARAAKPHLKTVELALMSSVGKRDGFMYYANITVGTPGQLQTLLVDTGSANTFVFASNASFCEKRSCDDGTFNLSKSSTSEVINPGTFEAKFMMGTTWFKGDYIRDVVQISALKSSEAKRHVVMRVPTNTFSRRLDDLKTPIWTCQQTEAIRQAIYRTHGPWIFEPHKPQAR